jgi:hypothetical protein
MLGILGPPFPNICGASAHNFGLVLKTGDKTKITYDVKPLDPSMQYTALILAD